MRASNSARVVASLAVVIVPACFDPVYNHPACGPGGACPDGLTCTVAVNRCQGPLYEEAFDTTADFLRGQLASTSVDARGVLTPTAYTYGGLIAFGLEGTPLWHPGATDWSAVDSATASGAGLWRGDPITPTSHLDYLGVSNKVIVTIWLEGEIWLDAGAPETFSMQANNVGFLELASPGSAAYVRLVDSAGNVASQGARAFDPPVTGWYPIRIGFSDSDDQATLVVLHADGDGPLVAWTRDRLRARASELGGALRTVFFQQVLGGGVGAVPPIAHFENADLLPLTSFATAPQGTNTTDDWSARYVAQVYIEQAGSYTLSVTSDDGNRGRIGAMSGEASWVRGEQTGHAMTHVVAPLRAGWNDLSVDYNQVGGPRALHVQLDGPDFANTEVPRDRLRPVESADDRLAYGGDDTNYIVPDGGGTATAVVVAMPIAGYPGETVASLDLLYEVTSPQWEHIVVELETPAGTRVPIRVDNASLGEGKQFDQVTIPPGATGPLAALLGGPANGAWKLRVYEDAGDGQTSTVFFAKLTLHTTAGPEKIAHTASWLSPVLDFATAVASIEEVTWSQRVPDGATVVVMVRSCQRSDCSDGKWLAAPGQPTEITAARHMQLRVDMTSDGVNEPELRNLHLKAR